eukprot:scaffold61396_cov21-Tisochrysis_lutea.AAC.1
MQTHTYTHSSLPPPHTDASMPICAPMHAHTGKELNMKRVHDSFKHALLHVAPDYILLYYAESPCPPAEQGSTLEDQPASSWRGGSEAGADDVNRVSNPVCISPAWTDHQPFCWWLLMTGMF